MTKNALIVVDIQNDFLPNGALGVQGGDEIIPLVNRLVQLPFDLCLASQDYHPPHHCSFASAWQKNPSERILINGQEQTLWADHCVQGTFGAAFSKDLDVSHFTHITHKGIDPSVDSYSTFFDNQKLRSTGLEEYLQKKGVTDLYFAGLTTEYCIFYSVQDAISLGYKVHVILDACRGIDLRPGDVEKAVRKMMELGAELVTVEQVIKRFS